MLPPPPSSLLTNNPNFANLYKHLTTKILASDGSTIANKPEYESIRAALKDARASVIQDELLLRALEELATPAANTEQVESSALQPATTSTLSRKADASGITITTRGAVKSPTSQTQLDLPPDVRELVFNITAYLSSSSHLDPARPLPQDIEELIVDDITAFKSHLPQITNSLSSHLVDIERALSSLTTPFTPSLPNAIQQQSIKSSIPRSRIKNSNIQSQTRDPPPISLSAAISTLQSTTTTSRTQTLPQKLIQASESLQSLSNSHSSALKSQIRTLELETHGSRSRYATARSTYLCTVAKGIELKSRILALEREKAVYGDEEVVQRMVDEVEELEAEERRVEKREAELTGLLQVYEEVGRLAGLGVASSAGGGGGSARKGGGGGDTGMRGEEVFRVLGQRYREVEAEIEEVKKDIERMETRVWRGR